MQLRNGLFCAALLLVVLVGDLPQTVSGCLPVAPIVSKIKNVFKRTYYAPSVVNKGCFKKLNPENYKSVKGSVSAIKDLNWNKCRNHCYGPKSESKNKDDRIGLQGENCWCHHVFNKADQSADSDCGIKCAGNKKEICGGKNFISVYSAKIEKGND